jgi:pheromone shutdown protein TraB
MEILNEYTLAFISGWILPSALIGLIGDKRLIGFWKSILVCLLLSPVLGIIAVLASKSKQTDLVEKTILNAIKNSDAETLSSELGNLHTLLINGVLDKDEYEKAKEKLLS